MNFRLLKLLIPIGCLMLGFVALQADPPDSPSRNSFYVGLNGYQEVPAVYSMASGSLRLTLSDDEKKIDFELAYSGLSSTAAAAHIHFGLPATTGGVLLPLCGPPKAACPATSGKVTGTLLAADVQGVNGIPAGNLGAALTVIRDGATYVNVHTTTFPGGEIRGHIGNPNQAKVNPPDDVDEDDDEDDNGNGKGWAKGRK